MDEYGNDIITVEDENGEEHNFEILDRIETEDGTRYAALIPFYNSADELLNDDGELIILRVQEEDGEDYLEPIEDDDEFDEIAEIFEERLSDLYEFDNEDDSKEEE